MAKKCFAHRLVVEQGLAENSDAAKRLIMAGKVFAERENRLERVAKAGDRLDFGTSLQLKPAARFVSRGGLKLLGGIEGFGISPFGQICLDAGASTGGFTDCLLQHGAAKVYAVDVGVNLLHERLRADPRVRVLEGINIRLAPDNLLPEAVSLIVADLSFISLTSILPVCVRCLLPDGQILALLKPQFELLPGDVPRGIVRDELLLKKAVDKVLAFARSALPLNFEGCIPSPIKGSKGNQEYLVLWTYCR